MKILETDRLTLRLVQKPGFCFKQTVQLTPDDEKLDLFTPELIANEEKRH